MELPKLTPGEKDLIESKTFWGAVISGVGFGLQHFNVAIDQVAWTNYAVEFAGFGVVLYGRYRAHKPITSVFGLTLKRFMDQELAAIKAQQKSADNSTTEKDKSNA